FSMRVVQSVTVSPYLFDASMFYGHGNPAKVTVAFTMALNARMKGHDSTLILMAEAVELGKPGALGMDIGAPFEPVDALLARYLELGGRIAICSACMLHNGFSAEDMRPDYAIITAPQVVDLLMEATGSLQIT